MPGRDLSRDGGVDADRGTCLGGTKERSDRLTRALLRRWRLSDREHSLPRLTGPPSPWGPKCRFSSVVSGVKSMSRVRHRCPQQTFEGFVHRPVELAPVLFCDPLTAGVARGAGHSARYPPADPRSTPASTMPRSWP